MINWMPQGLTWKAFGQRLWAQLVRDDVMASAAELSFYFVLALFPFLLFLTSLLGYFADAGTELRANLLAYLGTVAPAKANVLIHDTIAEISEARSGGKLSFGLLAAVWAASTGMQAIITALNAAYGVREGRPWWKQRLVAIELTLALAVFVILALVLLLYGSQIAFIVARWFGFGDTFTSAWVILQWFFVLGFVLLAFNLLYFFAPNLKDSKWRWLLPGSILAVVIWLLISFGFRLYLHFFNNYSATYGSLGAVIVLLLWLYLTGAAIILGGEVNAVLENAAAEAGVPEAKQHGQKSPERETTRSDTEAGVP
jgi:membrane protein